MADVDYIHHQTVEIKKTKKVKKTKRRESGDHGNVEITEVEQTEQISNGHQNGNADLEGYVSFYSAIDTNVRLCFVIFHFFVP